MTKWQRRLRFLIGIFALAFVAMLPFTFKRPQNSPLASVPRSDPSAVVESSNGHLIRFNRTREDVTVEYDKQLTYKDGSTKLLGVRIVSKAREGGRTFTLTGQEGAVAQNETTIDLNGEVTLQASDGLTARTAHATYTENDGMVRGPGPVQFSRRRMSGSGTGMTYDKAQDLLVILDQATIRVGADKEGGAATEIASGTATVARREQLVRFERGLKTLRGRQVIEADNGLAHLHEGDDRVESVELRGNSRITGTTGAVGTLQSLIGRDMDLKYAADGSTLQRAVIMGDAILQLAGEKNAPGQRMSAKTLDVTLGPDGTTPIALKGQDAVELRFPAEPSGAARTIKAASVDGRGVAGSGLTSAAFTGEVDYREIGTGVNRVAKSAVLDVVLKPGTSAIEEAKFARNARFATESGLFAVAAVARYVLDKGTLELSGSEPGAARPHLTNDQINVDAARMDVTLAGPMLAANGDVRSVLLPAKKDATTNGQKSETRMPSMLKGDQPVNVVGERLDYDGAVSKATYTGKAKLWQSDTSVQAETITIDEKAGDLAASGSVATSSMLEQGSKDKKTKERVRSIGSSKEFQYAEALHRATYTGDAHLSGPQGDMTAVKIELYLTPSGDELERAEAYDNLTLREPHRKTTGSRLTYTTADETYVVTGLPVVIVDECNRETVGQRLVFVKATDTINLDGNGQVRTQTKGGQCS
jgi:LPS export ABC transporter protein LptC